MSVTDTQNVRTTCFKEHANHRAIPTWVCQTSEATQVIRPAVGPDWAMLVLFSQCQCPSLWPDHWSQPVDELALGSQAQQTHYRQTRKSFCKEPVAAGLSYKILTLCEDTSIPWGWVLHSPYVILTLLSTNKKHELFQPSSPIRTFCSLFSVNKVELPEALSLEPRLVPLPRTALVDTRVVGLQHLPIVCLPYQEVRSMRTGSRPLYLGLFYSPVCQHSTNSVW